MKLSILVVVALAAVASVAAVGTWKQTSFSASVAMGVSFESDKMGYIAGGINGQGPAVWASTDAGKTWSQAETQQATMFMAVGTNGADAIVSGFLSVEHNDDTGRQFTKSGGWGAVGPCQSAEGIHGLDGGLAVTGETLLYNGVGVSTNGGKNFTISTIWGTNSTMAARYGAFPSADTWFVSAGSWPEKNSLMANLATGEHQVSQRVSLHKNGRMELRKPGAHAAPAEPQGYVAGIGKTTDGGKTWTTVYSKMGEFYFNGIDCADEMNCIAVGEADSGSAPGARIYTTHDGGSTWKRTMFEAGAANSIMAARFVSAKEAWAAGGEFDSNFAGHFWHSTDGGDTWTLQKTPGVYATSLSFISADSGFATCILEDQQSGLAEYSA